MFQEVAKRSDHIFSVQLSYLEIYNDTLTDLLSTLAGPQPLVAPPGPAPRPGLALMEEPGGRVSVKGLSLHPVQSQGEALDLLFEVGAAAVCDELLTVSRCVLLYDAVKHVLL